MGGVDGEEVIPLLSFKKKVRLLETIFLGDNFLFSRTVGKLRKLKIRIFRW